VDADGKQLASGMTDDPKGPFVRYTDALTAIGNAKKPADIYNVAWRMDKNRFLQLWKAVCKTYKKENHCFRMGCGRDTLYYWVRDTNRNICFSETELHETMKLAILLGWAIKLNPNLPRAKRSCSRYLLRC